MLAMFIEKSPFVNYSVSRFLIPKYISHTYARRKELKKKVYIRRSESNM
jgi:hypothetical protein